MNRIFGRAIDSLHPTFTQLVSMAPVNVSSLPKVMPTAGVYLFSEGRRHMYVGRSKELRGRIQRHSRPGAKENMATFAFLLARRSTRLLRASYRAEGSRSHLLQNPVFRAAFAKAKIRIRKMDVRFVGEGRPVQQALLEICAAVALKTPYNDFETH